MELRQLRSGPPTWAYFIPNNDPTELDEIINWCWRTFGDDSHGDSWKMWATWKDTGVTVIINDQSMAAHLMMVWDR